MARTITLTNGNADEPTMAWASEALNAQSGDNGSLWLPEVSSARTFTTLADNVLTHSVIPGMNDWLDPRVGM